MAFSVLHVIGNSAVGGAEMQLLDLVTELAKFDVRGAVICPRPGPLSERLVQRDIEVDYVEMVDPRPGDEYKLRWSAVEELWPRPSPSSTSISHTR